MLVDLKTILSGTREGGYAVGLFNCVTLEMTRGIIAAAEELRSPVIIGPGESLLPGASLPDYADMMLGIARRASVPVAVHFDHGFTPELVEEAISLGFTSVMYDCSMLPFEENVRRIREMAKKAHAAGCSLEAEIGHVGSNGSAEEDIARSVYTRPEDALRFAKANVLRNNLQDQVEVRFVDVTTPGRDPRFSEGFDLIAASELLYLDELHRPLLKFVDRHLAPGGKALFCTDLARAKPHFVKLAAKSFKLMEGRIGVKSRDEDGEEQRRIYSILILERP